MKRYIYVLILFSFLVFTMNSFSKQRDKNSPYVSAAAGTFSSGNSDRYGSASAAFSIGFGIPIYKSISFYGKASYLSKSNFTAFEDVQYLDQDLNVVNEFSRVNASFSRLIFNAGLQYSIFLPDDFILGLNGGMTYSLVNQEVSFLNNTSIQNIDNQSVYGYFGGLFVEKKVKESDLSILAEAQYLYYDSDVIQFRRALSGMNFNFGFRYYFTN